MNRPALLAWAALAALAAQAAASGGGVILGPRRIESPPLALVAGKVVPMAGDPIPGGIVLIRDSKIEAVGRRDRIAVPAGYRVIEMPEALLLPGFIEAHSHQGARTTRDLNDMIQQINQGLRNLDFISYDHDAVKRARAGGVTALLFLPGSGTNMAGWGTLMKTWGRTVEEALIRYPGVLKIAQAGNPERPFGDLGAGRMGMTALLRDMFQKARDYHAAWTAFEKGEAKTAPRLDPSLEPFRPVFRREVPVCVHTQMYQPTLATMRLCGDEFGLIYYPTHSTFDGYKVATEAKARGTFINCGPRKYHFDRDTGRMIGVDFEWWKVIGEDHHSVNTDSPVLPQEELPLQGAMASRLGLPPHVAIKGLTVNNARLLLVQDRMGSIEPGKDADLVFWSGDPLDPRSRVLLTIINGHIAYDPDRDGRLF